MLAQADVELQRELQDAGLWDRLRETTAAVSGGGGSNNGAWPADRGSAASPLDRVALLLELAPVLTGSAAVYAALQGDDPSREAQWQGA